MKKKEICYNIKFENHAWKRTLLQLYCQKYKFFEELLQLQTNHNCILKEMQMQSYRLGMLAKLMQKSPSLLTIYLFHLFFLDK